MTLRAVIYARYSSDHQRDASIADQVRLCKERISAEGWELVQVFQDPAISGASSFRPGYQAVLKAARHGEFDVVVAEALDRLSRDQEDVAGFFKRMTFAGIQILTLSEGEISELHVGLKGTMNALFLKDLADKTRRGLRGRVEAGKSAGGLCYGYTAVVQHDERGERIRGERRIKPDQAAIVVRIFEMFAGGMSPVAIARTLNSEKVPGPSGQPWRDTTIRGHALRGTGILRNELHIGRLVWNRMRYIKDPATGKRVSRMNPKAQWIEQDVPELRLIKPDLWERVQSRLGQIREASGADKPGWPKFWESRRARHILTGKITCGCCGGAVASIGRDYLACNSARRQGVCANHGSIRRHVLENLVLQALQTELMQPDHVAIFVSEFTAEWNRLQAERTAGRSGMERELAQVERKLNGLIDAIADGLRAQGLQAKLDALANRQTELTGQLENEAPALPRLHPNLAEVYRSKVSALAASLQRQDNPEALELLRGLIDGVTLTPAAGGGFTIGLIGEIAALIRLGQSGASNDNSDTAGSVAGIGSEMFGSSVKLVAGIGFEPMTFRL